MWEPVNIATRDLYHGPGGTRMKPDLRKITLIRKETSGNNLKYRIKDGSGREWVAKIADESQPETVAVRLLWGIGYKTEVNYLVPQLTIPGKKTYKNVRLEARPANVTREGRWDWEENPFTGSRELDGLKVMMALINNWDLKNDNTVVLVTGGRKEYVISDLGAAFGKLSPTSKPILTRFGRSVNNPNHFARSSFVKGVTPEGHIDLAYKGKQERLMDGIKFENARWLAGLLRQLSDKQISDAFRAANYSPAEVRLLTDAVKKRIADLNAPKDLYEARR